MKPNEYNKLQVERLQLTWSMVTELVRFWQEHHDLEVDGYGGPATQGSLEEVLAPASVPAGGWPPFEGPPCGGSGRSDLPLQPRGRRELYQLLGNPGSGSLDKGWFRENIVELHRSHGNRLPNVPAKWYVQVHRVVEPYLREALRRAGIADPHYRIERIGSFNFRHIRHDPSRPLSTHSWGVAVDIDPGRNFTKRFKRGEMPEAWSEEWMKIWPDGVSRAFVEAFQSCGFAWGADWDEDGTSTDHTFADPMHFEWIARDGMRINA